MCTQNDPVPVGPGLTLDQQRPLLVLTMFFLSLAAPGALGDLSARPEAPRFQGEDDSRSGKSKKSRKTKLSPEAALVKKHLADYLHPSKIKFLKGGRVRLLFSFSEKSEHHEKIFLPRIGAGITAPFRWSQETEERVVGGDRGIRISDHGFALLDCWFLDDVEAQIEVLQHINYSPRMYVAITFNNEKGRGLGSNYGSQCALFANGRLARRGTGKTTGIPFNVKAKLGLVVKDGFAEARKGSSSRPRDRMKYSRKSYPSGRLGFSWGGSMSATITSLEVTGKLDIPRMAKLLSQKLDLD